MINRKVRAQRRQKRLEDALGTESLYRRYKAFLDWLDISHVKLHGFKYSKRNSRYFPSGEHYVEVREKGARKIRIYKDKKTMAKISLTNGTRLHKREIELTKYDVDVLACICFYVANVDNPKPYRSALFGTFNTDATTRAIGVAILQIKIELERISPGFLKNEIKSSKRRAIKLLHFCLVTKETKNLSLGLPKGIHN